MAKQTNNSPNVNGAAVGYQAKLLATADALWYNMGRIEGQIAHGNMFHNDRFQDLKADFILATPPFDIFEALCRQRGIASNNKGAS